MDESFVTLEITGWRGVGLSWLALGIVVMHLPALRDVMASLSAEA